MCNVHGYVHNMHKELLLVFGSMVQLLTNNHNQIMINNLPNVWLSIIFNPHLVALFLEVGVTLGTQMTILANKS